VPQLWYTKGGLIKMTLITRITKKIQKKSNARPKSLVLYIPASIRDIMELQDGTNVNVDVILENEERYIKITKID
jgi:antitoxin component of MazEF toxin-antitoxin module